jgi:hypothetical protein
MEVHNFLVFGSFRSQFRIRCLVQNELSMMCDTTLTSIGSIDDNSLFIDKKAYQAEGLSLILSSLLRLLHRCLGDFPFY